MSHRCVKCGKIYPSTAPEILRGCSCGSHYFFFFRDEDKVLRDETERLSPKEREEIMQDIKEVLGPAEIERPVILDLESIKVTKPGKFEIDLVSLFKKRPVIYKLEEGKYIIDIASTFHFFQKKE